MHTGMHLLEKDYVFSPTVALGGMQQCNLLFCTQEYTIIHKGQGTQTQHWKYWLKLIGTK